ncbi:MAG TPA: condensation domain-containing protein [Thermoanaerobaculia bacterium]|nr:condensation domain-containing protein [Thermoanaerobaculia bacterium]
MTSDGGPDPPELRAIPRRRRAALPASSSGGPPSPPPRQAPAILPPIERVPREGPMPATFYQQWAWESLNGRASPDFNLPFAVRYTDPISIPALLASLRELERRHEGLRTSLIPDADEPWTVCQVIHPPGGLQVPMIDLSGLPGEVRADELGRLAVEDASIAIELARPMLRVRLVRLDGADHVLLFNLGHLICDGWSIEILRGELAALYAGFAAGRPSLLPELPVQLADFAAWQQRIAAGDAVAGQLDYWRRRLAGVPPPLVLDGDWRPERSRGTEQAACWFSPLDTARVRGLARAQAATTPLVVLTALGMLLAAYTGETDLVIESKVLGRTRPEVAGIVGLFMNSLPHRLELAGRPGFAEALRRTRDGVLEDYCNQDVTYPQILRELFPGRRHLSRIGFNVEVSAERTAFEVRDREEDVFSHQGRRPDSERVKYDLLLYAREDREQLRLMLVADGSRFRQETVAGIAADLEELIRHALGDPAAPAERLLPRPRYLRKIAESQL